MKRQKREEGFTLIELISVVVIIMILAALVMPRFAGKAREARIGAANVQIRNFEVALDGYELDNGAYPTTEMGLTALRKEPAGALNWKGPYLKRAIPKDPWGNLYIYTSPGQHGDYDLKSFGPDGVDGGGDDITNWDEEEKTE